MRCDTAGWNGVGQSGSQSQSQKPQGPLHYTQQKLIIIKSESAGEMELLVVVLVFALLGGDTHTVVGGVCGLDFAFFRGGGDFIIFALVLAFLTHRCLCDPLSEASSRDAAMPEKF